MLLYLFLLLSHILGLKAADTISPDQDEVSGREGRPLTLTCTYQTSYSYPYLYWYKQHSDLQAPQFILWKGAKSRSDEEYIPESSRKRYSSETSSTTTSLTIRKLTLADTGLYYCALEAPTWYALTFGKPIKVTVTPKDDTYKGDPALYVLSPLLPQGYPPKTADQLGPDVCLATDFYPKDGEMVLNTEGGPVKVETTAAAFSTATKSYYFAGFSNKTIHSCQLHNSSSSNEADDLCEGIYPEKAKLNFYLLVMNAVRVVFTKTLAFNTILTIRAVLF